jgi:methylthioribose-1-phosphate isomerase
LYCAAPSSTIDRALASGDAIPIEERSRDELDAPAQAAVWNPAFDVTPANLVSAYITDRGVVHPPFPA